MTNPRRSQGVALRAALLVTAAASGAAACNEPNPFADFDIDFDVLDAAETVGEADGDDGGAGDVAPDGNDADDDVAPGDVPDRDEAPDADGRDGADGDDAGDDAGDAGDDADDAGDDAGDDDDGTGDVSPDGGDTSCPDNGCGGCDPLPLLGAPCGPCALDTLVCSGIDALMCSGATTCVGEPPAAPEWLDASDGAFADRVRLSWAAVAGATGYRVYRDGAWMADVRGATTIDDLAAPPPGPLTPPTDVFAEDGYDGITLRWLPSMSDPGEEAAYRVVAFGPGGEGEASPVDGGSRGGLSVRGYEVALNGGDWTETDGTATSVLLDAAWLAPPAIRPGTATATTDDPAGVRLEAAGWSIAEVEVTARVRALSSGEPSEPSEPATGRWLTEALEYAWASATARSGPYDPPAWFGASALDTRLFGVGGERFYLLTVSSGSLASVSAAPVRGAVPTPPAAPVVAASTDDADAVIVSWDAIEGATAYEVSVNGGAWIAVATNQYVDTAAPGARITACTPAASDGTLPDRVSLTCPGGSITPGASRTYRVRTVSPAGVSLPSAEASGRRASGALVYQWERSATAEATAFAAWTGAPTTATGSDATVPFQQRRHYRVLMTAGSGVSSVVTGSDEGYRGTAPQVRTVSATGVTRNAATLRGNVDSLGGAPSGRRGFCYDTFGVFGCGTFGCGLFGTQVWLEGAAAEGAYSLTLTGLAPSTTAYYCAVVETDAGTVSGSQLSFTTLAFASCGNGTLDVSQGEECDGAAPVGDTCASRGFTTGTVTCTAGCTIDASGCHTPPLVETRPATGITSHRATLQGRITRLGDPQPSDHGFCYTRSAGTQTFTFDDATLDERFATEVPAWFASTPGRGDTGYAARSGLTPTNGTSAMSLDVTLTTASTVAFWLRTSSEEDYDGLTFVVDGVDQEFWSGEVLWTRVEFPLTAGAHTLVWRYTKDGSLTVGSDAAWIDDLTISNVAGEPGGVPVIDGSASTCVSLGAPGGTGTFSAVHAGMEPGVRYLVRAWATTSVGTTYGDVQTFTTLASSATCGNARVDSGEQCDGTAGLAACDGAPCAADCRCDVSP